MQTLPIFLTITGRAVILLGSGEPAAAKARLVEAAGGRLVGEDAGDAMLAFVALEDEGEAVAAAARLRGRGLLVNVVDRPARSDFLMGAVIDRSPVVVAVSTGGASASLSRALRGRLEALLPASLGPLAAAIGAARRAASAAHPGVDARRRLWERALAEHGPLDPLRRIENAPEAVAAAVAGDSAAVRAVQRIVVASEDPGELTLNQLGWLGRCDALLVEGPVAPAIIGRARRDAVRIEALADAPADGLTVVLCSAQAISSVSQ